MDIIQKQHDQDLLLLTAHNYRGEGSPKVMWVTRERFQRVPQQNVERFKIEVVQTAAYGTSEWKVANETALP